MCCLFGLMDYNNVFSRRQRERIIRVQSLESQQRGTDATGIAYLGNGNLTIYKRPLPAAKTWLHFPAEAGTIMGHTRMTTQGNEKKNRNNHPFKGSCGQDSFALAHNGVLYNDRYLRKSLKLPETNIETDSYAAVQLLEQHKALDFPAIKDIAETVEGSFCFSILDSCGRLFLVKGNNPLAIYHFKEGFYIYASTEEILKRALSKLGLLSWSHKAITCREGDILCIEADGTMEKGSFEYYDYYSYHYFSKPYTYSPAFEDTYVDLLRDMAPCFGYTAEDVDYLLEDGFTPEEIEEYFYSECCINGADLNHRF